MAARKSTPSASVSCAQNRSLTTLKELGMSAMQVRTYETRGEQYLLIKLPPASWKSRALMFIALDIAAQSVFESGHRGGSGMVHRVKCQRRTAEQIRVLALDAYF